MAAVAAAAASAKPTKVRRTDAEVALDPLWQVGIDVMHGTARVPDDVKYRERSPLARGAAHYLKQARVALVVKAVQLFNATAAVALSSDGAVLDGGVPAPLVDRGVLTALLLTSFSYADANLDDGGDGGDGVCGITALAVLKTQAVVATRRRSSVAAYAAAATALERDDALAPFIATVMCEAGVSAGSAAGVDTAAYFAALLRAYADATPAQRLVQLDAVQDALRTWRARLDACVSRVATNAAVLVERATAVGVATASPVMLAEAADALLDTALTLTRAAQRRSLLLAGASSVLRGWAATLRDVVERLAGVSYSPAASASPPLLMQAEEEEAEAIEEEEVLEDADEDEQLMATAVAEVLAAPEHYGKGAMVGGKDLLVGMWRRQQQLREVALQDAAPTPPVGDGDDGDDVGMAAITVAARAQAGYTPVMYNPITEPGVSPAPAAAARRYTPSCAVLRPPSRLGYAAQAWHMDSGGSSGVAAWPSPPAPKRVRTSI